MGETILGVDVKAKKYVRIIDQARHAGLYILGRPGTGKTTLIKRLIINDYIRDHGVFFLDPHGDAAEELRNLDKEYNTSLKYRPIILNPEDNTRSFGINLTSCPNVSSLTDRIDTYTRAYNVFRQAFNQEWGPWLQLIIQNTLYVFIENQGYTLAEAPQFLLNADFRNHLVANMRYNPEVIDFWRYRFSQRRERDQEQQVDAALTRFSTFLGHQYVRDIIRQPKTTVDFGRIMERREIVFLKLSANLASDIKQFIGTIIISELLHAARNRPVASRHQFSIFVDEFQNFVTGDFASLITEGRKFGIATTIAHQERAGQLRENPQVLSATAAAANLVCFQLTVKDAQELAPEFARSVEEIEGRDAELVISPRAVEDIWERGYQEPNIMEIRKSYFYLVDLLKSRPQDNYYTFDRARFTGLDFGDYDDWDYYRSTPDTVRLSISLLNDIYFQSMSGGRSISFDTMLTLIQNLGGLFGFYPTMRATMTPSGRTTLKRTIEGVYEQAYRDLPVMRTHEYDRTRGGWQYSKFGTVSFPGRLPRSFADAAKQEISEHSPNHIIKRRIARIFNYNFVGADPLYKDWFHTVPEHMLPDTFHTASEYHEWVRLAESLGMPQYQIDSMFTWEPRPFSSYEKDYLTKYLVATLTNEGSPTNSALEFIEHFYDPQDEVATKRAIWQETKLQRFISSLFMVAPYVLSGNPIKIPSGRYEETVKVERTQQDLVNEMVQELINLPPYTAYMKLCNYTTEVHKVKTELPE